MLYIAYSDTNITYSMAVEAQEKIIDSEDGNKKEQLAVTFSNGALQQLEDLRNHLKFDNKLKVVELGISILQNLKEKDLLRNENKDN